MTTVAVVQATPVFLDREATTSKACALIAEAAAGGARLVLFPEAFVPTYPDWVWRLPSWADHEYTSRLRAEAVDVPGPVTDRLGVAARDAGAYVAMGVNERVGGTLYNTLLYFGPDGRLLGKHRKLQATGGERSIWGRGDGSTLGVVRTPFATFGGLICWENYMPLARAAMYAQGIDVLLAPTWDNDEVWTATLRHIAKEGRTYVLGATPLLRGADVPADLRGEVYGGEDDWMSRGNSAIVGPDGRILAAAPPEVETVIYADIDLARVRQARHEFDVDGHYARPDVFALSVDARERRSVTLTR